jgi:NSS family neurotransmitter:Na+ symporter
MEQRSKWSSQTGFLFAAMGSAIGLGNIWRFPYLAYEKGGGAFLVAYVVALLTAGIPLMLLEFGLGHSMVGSSVVSFWRVNKRLEWFGWWMPLLVMYGIMLYYMVVLGWCLNYVWFSLDLAWGKDTQSFFLNSFLKVSNNAWDLQDIVGPIFVSTALVWLIIWFICYKEVNKGIERACKVFMPALFALTLILVFWGCSLEGAGRGLRYYLTPDWSKLRDVTLWTSAYGQIFFSLSIGFGIMITYASYLPRKSNLVQNAIITSVADSAYSFTAGLAVFSVLGYLAHTQNLPATNEAFRQVVKEGPILAFVTYPQAISELPAFNRLFGVFFFICLALAGITSAISIVEALTCAIRDKFSLARGKVVGILCATGFLGSLVFVCRSGLTWLDIADQFINHYGLVLAGFLECVFIGWLLKARTIRKHVNAVSAWRLPEMWDYLVKFVSPAVLGVIYVMDVVNLIRNGYPSGPGKEPYPSSWLILIGVNALILSIILTTVFTIYPWRRKPEDIIHRPEEDKLLV